MLPGLFCLWPSAPSFPSCGCRDGAECPWPGTGGNAVSIEAWPVWLECRGAPRAKDGLERSPKVSIS